MICKLSIHSLQISLLILEAASNSLKPDYSVNMFNTETVILSLGDPDDAKNDDLEIIKAPLGKSTLEKKMGKFHKYVNLLEMTVSPEEKFYFKPSNNLKNYIPLLSVSHLDPSSEISDSHENELDRPTRRKKKRKKKRLRTTRLRRSAKKKRSLRKREAIIPTEGQAEADYDYLQKEYLDFVNQSMQSRTAYKYSDEGKPEESFKEIMYKIADVRTPKNCTEVAKVGVQAVECIVQNFRSGQLDEKQMIYAIFMIMMIWFGVYLIVALPLWCYKGWCCCCCRCEVCLPLKTVEQVQQYLLYNPPGVHINSQGEEERYQPTQHEIELYERIKRSISEL